MPLKPGTISDFNNSMAQEMETAFMNNWHSVMGNDVPKPASNNQMKLMFIAIAKGVVEHLKKNPSSFEVITTVESSVTKTNGNVTKIISNPA